VTENDVSVLESILGQSKTELAPLLQDDEFFELFGAHKILRDFQLDPDDIDSGQIGTKQSNKSGSDGGIDGFYILANGRIIRELTEITELKEHLKKNVAVDIILIQASTQSGFTLDRLTRLRDTCEDIFDVNLDPKDFSESYNSLLLDAINRFRTLYQLLATRYPTYNLSIFYVTKADSKTINPSTRGTAEDIGKAVCKLVPQFKTPQFSFIGARELINLASKPPKLDFTLKCSGVMGSARTGGNIGFMSLADFLTFITTEEGELRTGLFESNLRDYQGDVSVNKAIEETLTHPSSEDFWWLNNGITIIAEKAVGETKQIHLTDPQIVNGLQTSQKIYDYFVANKEQAKNDARELLVRVVQAPDAKSHDAIIRATNSQTPIPAPFLWATNEIHRDIENYFSGKGLYYDRRKNSWRREGIPFDKVVGIMELAQAVASIIRQEPEHARARPGRFFSSKKYHDSIFASKYKLDMYVVCARLKKKAAQFLKKAEKERSDRNNLLFYLITAVACVALKKAKPRAKSVASLAVDKVTDATFEAALKIVRPIYEKFEEPAKASKGNEMADQVRATLYTKYRHPKA